jgi:SAM-dependent methyltransferase
MNSSACSEATARYQTTREASAKPQTLREQFGNPTGTWGWLIGQLMAMKNSERSHWVLARLEAEKQHRVLEIGFGSGIDVKRLLNVVGFVAGVDISETMLNMARKRNAKALQAGRAELKLGHACELPFADGSFDRVMSINSVQFWDELDAGLCEVGRVLVPGGRAVIAIEPRNVGATEATSREWGERLHREMERVGFESIRLDYSSGRVPTICAIGQR